MKLRIAIWAVAGAVVAALWAIYMSATFPAPLGSLRTLVHLTCPVALAHHYAIGFYSVLLINAATYALVGAVVETVRRQYKPRVI